MPPPAPEPAAQVPRTPATQLPHHQAPSWFQDPCELHERRSGLGQEAEYRDHDDLVEGGRREGKGLDVALHGLQGNPRPPGARSGQGEHGSGEIHRRHPNTFSREFHGQSPVTGSGVQDTTPRDRVHQAHERTALILPHLSTQRGLEPVGIGPGFLGPLDQNTSTLSAQMVQSANSSMVLRSGPSASSSSVSPRASMQVLHAPTWTSRDQAILSIRSRL